MSNEIQVGDFVTINDVGELYSTYKDYVDARGLRRRAHWTYGANSVPTNHIFKVLHIGEHMSYDHRILAYCADVQTGQGYLIGIKGISKIPMFSIGDTVRISTWLMKFSSNELRVVAPKMEKYIGKTAKITHVADSNGLWYHLDIDGGEWNWDAAGLTLVKAATAPVPPVKTKVTSRKPKENYSITAKRNITKEYLALPKSPAGRVKRGSIGKLFVKYGITGLTTKQQYDLLKVSRGWVWQLNNGGWDTSNAVAFQRNSPLQGTL